MTTIKVLSMACVGALLLTACENSRPRNITALQEQAATEKNQAGLLATQPPPSLSWSMERDNLIKRFKLMNDRAVAFYMYVFIEGVADPVGYYMVNKVSSVDSQLTNPEQIVLSCEGAIGCDRHVLSSPAEDGSYGTNGDGVFGFTPEDAYMEHNMKYITSTIPLHFTKPVQRLAVITGDEAVKMLAISKNAMSR